MINGRKICVVLPAYNAGKTLEQTFHEIPFDIVDDVILVDDRSRDDTVAVARRLGIPHVIEHAVNRGYGGNQKTCYKTARAIGADIVVMLHPDYQYTPKLIHSMCYLIANDVYPVVLGSRILGKGALKGGMPLYKYVFNRFLTLFQNVLMRQKLSEYHTGFRAFSREVLEAIDYEANSDDFVFDNQMLAQIFHAGYEIAEITCPTKYFDEASSINFSRSLKYGFGVMGVSLIYALHPVLQKAGLEGFRIFQQPAVQPAPAAVDFRTGTSPGKTDTHPPEEYRRRAA
jgi:glycosyltransferase involved in cell wall biosynthesis